MKTHLRTHGHLFRRFIHVSVGIIPLLYYWYGDVLASSLSMSLDRLVIILVILITVIEAIRLSCRVTVFGLRNYETKKISSIAWTLFSMGMIFLFSPKIGNHGGGIGIPLIWSLCIADPLMGEARIMGLSPLFIMLIGMLSVAAVWILCVILFSTPAWVIPIIVPVTVAAELIELSWIDDNATILLVPWILLLLMVK
jgi:hypothetical protein